MGWRNKIKNTIEKLAYKKYLQTQTIDNENECAKEPQPKEK
jgi:hypothetical protein